MEKPGFGFRTAIRSNSGPIFALNPMQIRNQCCGSGSAIRWFLPPGSGMEKIQIRDPGRTFLILFLRTLYQLLGIKILKFFDADRIRDLVNPGYGMEKSRIRDKHPGSATLSETL